MSVSLIEDGPAEDDHVEDDYDAVEYREEAHLQIFMMRMIKYIQMQTNWDQIWMIRIRMMGPAAGRML